MEKEEQQKNWDKIQVLHNLKMSWRFAKNHKGRLFLYMFFSVILCIIGAITPLLSARELLHLTAEKWNSLINIALFILIVELSRNVCRFFSQKSAQIFFRDTLLDLQMQLSNDTLSLETSVLDTHNSGIFINRLSKDSSDIANVFMELTNIIADIVASIGIVFAMFVVNKWVFLYYIIAIIIIFFFEKLRMKKYFERDKVFRKLNEKNTALFTELIRGLRDIKSLNASSNFTEKMEVRLRDSNNERYKMSRVQRFYNLLTGSVQDGFDFGMILLGVFLMTKGNLTVASFVVLFTYRYNMFNLLSYFTRFMEMFKNFNLSASRVFEILDSPEFSKEKFGSKHIDKINGDFAFHDVTFSYHDENTILDHLSFKVKANETVAFVGKSGAGKTTIFSLLNRLYDVKEGMITIDGIDIKELDNESIRNNMSIITQNPYIFNFTIKENLTMVKKDATEEEIIEACKTAQLHDFITTLPEGYDTKVGEGGVALSGGQRQRLAIARALIKKTEIILFDEATSALDNETQRSIQQAINNMKGEYTILIIAHRLSTVIGSNRIILLDQGKVLDEGSHTELLEKNDFYRSLYEEELEA